MNDFTFALRQALRNPGLSVTIIVTIALGVGINTGIFSVLNGVLFRELPAPDAHELVSIYQTLDGVPDREGAQEMGLVSTAEYRTYNERTRTLSGILGHSDPTLATLGGESPRETNGVIVTCGYFDVLRQQPPIGRGLLAADCETGAPPVVVLGHKFWTTTFAADPAIVGRTIELNRQLFTVVGIAAAGTYGGFLYDAAFFAPIAAQPLLLPNENAYANDKNSWLLLVGRRDDRASLDQVRAELAVIAAQIDQQRPGRATTLNIERATPLSIPMFRGVAMAVGSVVMAAFGLVLLVACANVANLLLARGTTRSREIAVRLSLGASRVRVVRQLLTESALLAIAGGALGVVLSLWTFQALLAFALPTFSPVGIPPLVLDASPDVRVLAVSLGLIFGTGLLFGLAPALQLSKPDLHSVIKQDASGTVGRGGGRLQATLVGTQVALCMILMIAAGLLLRGLNAARTIDPGFNYRDVAYASYDLTSYATNPDQAAAFRRELLERVSAMPGIEAVAYAAQEPLSSGTMSTAIRLPDQAERQLRQVGLNVVTPDYFSLVGIPVVRGLGFSGAEPTDESREAIVTETTARNYWPGQDPIGQTLLWQRAQDQVIPLRVVGVAKDAQVSRLGEIDDYFVYLPARLDSPFDLEFLVKGRIEFKAMAAGIQAAMRALDPGLAVRVSPLSTNIEWSRHLAGMVTATAAALGALALVLAVVGIYGVVAYFASRRVREIGIRLALGARTGDVLRLILRRTLRPVAIGALIGVVLAVAASRVLSSVLFGVSPADSVGMGGATLFVLCIALTAGLVAARRALRSDPMRALREE